MQKSLFFSILFLFFSLHAQTQPDSVAIDSTQRTVVVIPVKGTVDAAMSSFITRALIESKKYPNRIIILELDTYGGEVDAAFQIVDTLLNVKDTIISYVKTKAISAGALIALSGRKLIMKEATTIGDVAPLSYSEDGPKMLGEKFQSPIRAKFRTLAKRNGYPSTLTEAMVTEEMEVYEVKFKDTTLYLDSTQMADLEPSEKKAIISTKTIVEKGELLTMDDIEAANFGFSTMSVKGFDEMLSILGYENATIIRIDQNWSEIFVRFIGTIAPILLMLGFAALYIEMKAPGFGLPGIVGITCLALVFLSQYMVGLADYTELLILLIGLTLILIEVFVIPGFGVIGFAGIALLIIGMVLSFQDFVIPKPEFPWQAEQLTQNLLKVILSIIGSIVLTILFFRYAFPHLAGVIKGPYLMTTLGDAKAEPDSGYFPEIGEHGIVTSPLRPAGKIAIKGETYDVVADGEFIDEGIEVQVNEISGNRIVVSRRLAS